MARRVAATLALLTICALMPASAGAVARFGPAQLASAGPTGGNGPYDVGGALGTPGVESRAYFETNEALVAEDGDQARDVYETDGRRVSLVSAGTPTAGKPLGATLGGSSLDGARASSTHTSRWSPRMPIAASTASTSTNGRPALRR